MNADLEKLLHRRVVIDGREHELRLLPPRMEDIGGLIASPAYLKSSPSGLLTGELNQIAELDERPIWQVLDKTAALNNPQTLEPVWRARAELYKWLPEQGRIRARCPVCHEWHDLDLLFYVIALRLPPWHFITADGFLETPALSTPEPKVSVGLSTRPPQIHIEPRKLASRPNGMLRASELRVEFPAARTGLAAPEDVISATLGTLDAESELAAWWRFAPPEGERDDEHMWWRWDDASFRAVLRIAVALRKLECGDGSTADSTPEAATRFFLADLHFLDIAYYATHELPVPADGGRAKVQCSCGSVYLPVR
jgi:hypothetical protein